MSGPVYREVRNAPSILIPQLPPSPGPGAEEAIARRWRRVRRRERVTFISKGAVVVAGLFIAIWAVKALFLRLVFLFG